LNDNDGKHDELEFPTVEVREAASTTNNDEDGRENKLTTKEKI